MGETPSSETEIDQRTLMLDRHRRIANNWMRTARRIILLNQFLVVGTVLLSSGLAVYASRYSGNIIIELLSFLIAVLVAAQQFYAVSLRAERYFAASATLLN